MTDLSPAAQAVFNAAWADTGIILGDREGTLRAQLAAALRALAIRINGADAIRQDVLDIADELEAQGG
jgi:hypothetical protein